MGAAEWSGYSTSNQTTAVAPFHHHHSGSGYHHHHHIHHQGYNFDTITANAIEHPSGSYPSGKTKSTQFNIVKPSLTSPPSFTTLSSSPPSAHVLFFSGLPLHSHHFDSFIGSGHASFCSQPPPGQLFLYDLKLPKFNIDWRLSYRKRSDQF